MKPTFSILLGGAILSAIACAHTDYSKTPEVYGFDVCDDKRIAPGGRLTIQETAEITARFQSGEDRVESAEEASRLFAHSSISGGAYAMDAKDAADHAPIDAFVGGTDFAHDELVLIGETVTGSDGYAGSFSANGRTAIVSHSCGQVGGAAPPTASWVAVYRVPRGNVLTGVGCGSCGPPVPCCPP